jgi:TonB family protein
MFMTFRHTLYISVAAHILVFGSAIAFARYGSGLLLMSPGIIQVALVSPDEHAGTGGNAAPARNGRAALARAHQPLEKQVVEQIIETPAEEGTELDEVPVPQTGAAQESRNDGSEGVGTTASVQGTGQGAFGQTGFAALGEWAALAAAIEQTKSYPRIARERGIEGEVRLRFRLTPSGSVEKIEIVQSSGYEILDRASIGAVYRAEPLPYVSGWVEMPMRYVLKR